MSDALPDEVGKALDRMIEYLVDSERRDYFDGNREHRTNHIYLAVYAVAKWRGLDLDHPDMTEDDDEDEEDGKVLEDMFASEIDALGLSLERLKAAHAQGELNHLSEDEISKLLTAAQSRDMQKTILR